MSGAIAPRIDSELVRERWPSRRESRGRWPSSFIRCSSFWVPSEAAANDDVLGGEHLLAAARCLALVNFTRTS